MSQMSRSLVFVAALGAACHDHDHDPDHNDHHNEEHGHDHNASAAVAPPTLDITVYENGLELFMEYPSFVVGASSPLVAHLTDARDPDAFHGVGKGRVTATLTMKDGADERFIADEPQRLGVFKPVVLPTKAGAATLTLTLEGPQAAGVVHVGDVVVYADLAAANQAAPAERTGGEPSMPYFKEAQWKTEYATAVAAKRVLQGGIGVMGELQPVAGQAAELSAPVAGRVVVGTVVPHVGQQVKRGELLLTLVPTGALQGDRASMELEWARAKAEAGLADRDLARTRELVAARAASQKQADAAEVEAEVARARVKAAAERLSLLDASQSGTGRGAAGSSYDLRAPLAGVVAFADVLPDAVVDAGRRLVTVVNPERLWLTAHVPEVDVGRTAKSEQASFTVAGFEHAFEVRPPDGKRVAVGAVVDSVTRTVPLVFDLKNPDGVLKPGMFADVTLFTGQTVEGVAVPDEAVIDDDGKSVVYVMDGGEAFFKRRVRTGVKSAGFVQILEGVVEGERVVARGAFEIKLANAGGIPAHGHQH